MTKPLALTMGDPAGVGPQITMAAWQQLRDSPQHCFFVIGAPELYAPHMAVEIINHPDEAPEIFQKALPVLPLANMPIPKSGQPDSDTAPAIIKAIETAVSLCLEGQADAVVTNPLNKALLYGVGFKHPGHTEFIAALCESSSKRSTQPVMLLTGGGLRVALATIHMPLREACNALTTSALIALGEIVSTSMRQDFGLPAPKIAFTGLNPHAGENGTIGREEVEIINPAAEQLRASGINISDARSADTVFAEALTGRFDAIIAMTHDQGLIPVKTLDMWGGVNSTLGLPIVRTSPDHGTGYDAAAEGNARPDSLIAAIKQSRLMTDNRKRLA